MNFEVKSNVTIIIENKRLHFECSVLEYFVSYFLILFIISITSNTTVIWNYIKYRKKLLKNVNILTFALVVLSLIETLVGLPIDIITAFSCKYMML